MITPIWLYLASKEMWRNWGRFLLVSLVVALITLLVVFLAGLAEGLSLSNKEFLSKLEGELVVFQEQANLSLPSSQLDNETKRKIQRVSGVADVGAVGFSSVFITNDGNDWEKSVSLFGVELGKPGEPAPLEGRRLSGARAKEVIIGGHVALSTGLNIGDTLVVKSTQAGEEELHSLEIVGIADGQQFFFQPSIFVPIQTWDLIRPTPIVDNSQRSMTYNIVNVKMVNSSNEVDLAQIIQQEVQDIEVTDRQTAYEAVPGYQDQQRTFNTQQGFTLLIGILVVGGFFQIQTLQKVGQVGMLKALGTPNIVVSLTTTTQIFITNSLGVIIGAFATVLLASTLPPSIPIVFVGQQVAISLVTLLLIGPLGGLVSIRYLTKVEPLTALGLSS
jgi:putative ABC transport system permease protein